MLRIAGCVLAALALSAPAASARSPLKSKDMQTIRRDARARAHEYAEAYDAKGFKINCVKRGIYAARCTIRLIDIRAGTTDCNVRLVYVVTRSNVIEGDVARDGCA